jgi:geranylgeranyl pyrophosphate synthase
MARPGRALYDAKRAKWPAMVLQVAATFGASEELALHAATVVELIIGALDVVDDVVDGELGPEFPVNRSLNATLALLSLADAAAQPLAQRLPYSRFLLFREAIQQGLLTATTGEDADIRFEDDQAVDEQAALDMTARKSGALVGMAFRLAAALSTADPAILDDIRDFGVQVGVVVQLDNDAQACTARGALEDSDLRRRKKTLPVAYALQCARADGHQAFLDYAAGVGEPPDGQLREAQRYIAACGGLHFTWAVAESARSEAFGVLRRLSAKLEVDASALLGNLVPRLPAMSAPRC